MEIKERVRYAIDDFINGSMEGKEYIRILKECLERIEELEENNKKLRERITDLGELYDWYDC